MAPLSLLVCQHPSIQICRVAA